MKVFCTSSYHPLCACVRDKSLSHVRLFVTLWTVACQASMGFFRWEYLSGFSCPPPGDLPDPGIELTSLMSPASVGRFFTTSATWEASIIDWFKVRQLPQTMWVGFLNKLKASKSFREKKFCFKYRLKYAWLSTLSTSLYILDLTAPTIKGTNYLT